jgi:uncharacterized protein YneF (UPF0154 family)
MKLVLSISLGFAASLIAAVFIGFFIGMAFPLSIATPAYYAAEFAGIVISLTLWYFLGHWIYRYLERKDLPLAGHPV